jgi:hypothetical protein
VLPPGDPRYREHVAVGRHAHDGAEEDGITEAELATALLKGETIPDGQAVVWRELNGVRIVTVLRPEPFRGAALATTAFRIERQRKV